METLLQKYYEYFLKLNLQDNKKSEISSEFNSFYCLIINAYDINKDEKLKKELNIFTKFFQFSSIYHTTIDTSEYLVERRRNRFKQQNVSFDWFTPSKHLKTDYYNKEFIYTYPSTRNVWAKVYLSIKPEYYINTIIKIQKFIDILNNEYSIENTGQCKFRTTTPANDAIVLRFAQKEHYEKFLIFLNENKEIQESFDIANPFIPQDEYGLSIITDNGGSYNYFVTRMIWDYMFECKKNKENINIEKLIQFIIDYNPINDEMIYNNGTKIIEDFKYILISKLSNTKNCEILENIFNQNNKKYSKKQQ